jgi:hypothetical protein
MPTFMLFNLWEKYRKDEQDMNTSARRITRENCINKTSLIYTSHYVKRIKHTYPISTHSNAVKYLWLFFPLQRSSNETTEAFVFMQNDIKKRLINYWRWKRSWNWRCSKHFGKVRSNRTKRRKNLLVPYSQTYKFIFITLFVRLTLPQ